MGRTFMKRPKVRKDSGFWQEQFTKIAEEFVSELFNDGIVLDSEEGVALVNKYDQRWRIFARNQIAHNKDLFTKPEQRTSLTDHFITFVDKYSKRAKEPIKEPVEKRVTEDEVIDAIHAVLKEQGVNTKARTKTGLQRVINSKLDVESPAYIKVNEILNSVL